MKTKVDGKNFIGLTNEERGRIDQAAEKLSLKFSSFMRMAGLALAQRIMTDRTNKIEESSDVLSKIM